MKTALAGKGLVIRLATAIPREALPLASLEGIEIVPLDVDRVAALPAPLAAVILDGDAARPEVLRAACDSARLATVPKMIVADAERLHDLAARLRAEDAVAAPLTALDPRDLARRLRTLCDLGSTRVVLGLLQQAFEDGVTGFSIADANGDQPLLAISRAFERLTGYTQEDAVGRNCRFLRFDDGDAPQRVRFRQELARDRRAKMLVKNRRKDGSAWWNDLTVFAFRAQGVDLPLLGGVQHDVSELVEARSAIERLTQSLLERQAFDRAVLDGVDLGIVTTDASGRATYCNRAARELLSVESVPLDALDLHTALSIEHGVDRLVGATVSRTVVARDGTERAVEITVSRPEGEPRAFAFLLVLRDATHERKMQAAMRRVEHLTALGTMVAGFAHEIRNPVASLRTMAESLEEDLAESGIRLPHARRMLQVLARIERLVSTSLEFGSPATPRRGRHRPWAIVSAALATISAKTKGLHGEIRVEIDSDLPDVEVDEGQLVQVLVILLDNALDAAGAPQRVLVRAAIASRDSSRGHSQPPPAYVRFQVLDDGLGVPPHVEARMFDPFFTTKASGTGLGLSIAQQLLSENGARIELTSRANPTIFSIDCPVAM